MLSVELKSVNFSYGESENLVLKDINLEIKKGEVILLCGASGCGKSTLVQAINGIIPEQKEGKLTGQIYINEKDAKTKSVKEKSIDIGSVFQNPKSQFFHLNTTDELYFGAANHLVSLEEMNKRLFKIKDEFKISNLINRNIFNLSGGEKQRIACASVAMNRPNIYVLDEPSSNLDTESIESLKEILASLKESGATIIVAEHRLYYMLDICDKIYYMNSGEIKKEYTREAFLNLSDKERKTMGLRKFSNTEFLEIPSDKIEGEKITIENMKIKYGSQLIKDISKLEIPKNKIIGITGENGAGKSSFVRAFTGLHKTKGCKINGELLNRKKQQSNSFMVMQDVNSQLYCESVLDELIQLTDESDEVKDKAKKVLEKLNLGNLEDKHPMVLSGGQKQRLAIATALFLNKKYLIFDEPTSGLDYENMIRVSEILKSLKDKVECILVITHDKELIEECVEYEIHFEKDKDY